MTSPNLPSILRQPPTGPRARPRAGGWLPPLSQPPASTLEARLTQAFRMLGERSEPLVSMLYGRTRPAARRRATGVAGGSRP